MSGYQLMIRGELFRGRFRKGFDNPCLSNRKK